MLTSKPDSAATTTTDRQVRSAPVANGTEDLTTAPWRARLVTGEFLKVPQVLPGGDPAFQPFGTPELPLLPPPPERSRQPPTY